MVELWTVYIIYNPSEAWAQCKTLLSFIYFLVKKPGHNLIIILTIYSLIRDTISIRKGDDGERRYLPPEPPACLSPTTPHSQDHHHPHPVFLASYPALYYPVQGSLLTSGTSPCFCCWRYLAPGESISHFSLSTATAIYHIRIRSQISNSFSGHSTFCLISAHRGGIRQIPKL